MIHIHADRLIDTYTCMRTHAHTHIHIIHTHAHTHTHTHKSPKPSIAVVTVSIPHRYVSWCGQIPWGHNIHKYSCILTHTHFDV